MTRCVFRSHWAFYGCGGLRNTQGASQPHLVRCTLVTNAAPYSGAIYNRVNAIVPIDASILALDTQGGAIYSTSAATATAACSDVFRNAGSDWSGCIAGRVGSNNNRSLSPLFSYNARHEPSLHMVLIIVYDAAGGSWGSLGGRSRRTGLVFHARWGGSPASSGSEPTGTRMREPIEAAGLASSDLR